MKTIKLLFLFVLSITSVWWSWHLLNLNISKKDYYVQASATSIIFYRSDSNQELFSISPFDDYVYLDNNKKHLSETGDNTHLKPLPVDYIDQLQNLTSQQKKLSWEANTGLGNLIYKITIGSDNSVIISRDIRQLSAQPTSVGLSIVICQSCFVTDQKKRVYINQDFLNDNSISLLASQGLTPTVISDQLIPEDATNLIILDNNFNKKFNIPVGKSQAVYYDQKWQLIELRSETKLIDNQVINLN